MQVLPKLLVVLYNVTMKGKNNLSNDIVSQKQKYMISTLGDFFQTSKRGILISIAVSSPLCQYFIPLSKSLKYRPNQKIFSLAKTSLF